MKTTISNNYVFKLASQWDNTAAAVRSLKMTDAAMVSTPPWPFKKYRDQLRRLLIADCVLEYKQKASQSKPKFTISQIEEPIVTATTNGRMADLARIGVVRPTSMK